MTPLLEEAITRLQLNSAEGYRLSRIMRLSEAQNWRCCYCGVKMFAGHPAEDIFLYSSSMGMWPVMGGVPDEWVLAQLNNLRASIEHYKTSKIRGQERECVVACRLCNSSRGGAVKWNSARAQHRPESWWAITQRKLSEGTHPHCQYIMERAA